MLSFGQVKNNLEQLRKYLTKMQFFNSTDKKISNKDLEEANFRRAGNQLFLPLINFILIQYSTQIYWKIIEMVPSIKVVDDKQFIEHCFSIARKMLNMDVQLTSDQFLTNKYFQRKLEFLSKLSKNVFDRSEAIKKAKSKSVTNYAPSASEGLMHQNYAIQKMIDDDQDDQQEEVPRVINKIPARIDMDPFSSQKGLKDTVPIQKNKQQNRFIVDRQEFQEENVEIFMKKGRNEGVKRPNGKPINLGANKYGFDLDQNENQQQITTGNFNFGVTKSQNNQKKALKKQNNDQFNRFKLDAKKNQIKSYKPEPQEDEDSVEYVSKQDFTQLLQLVMSTSQTVNELSGKFCQFQAKIGADVSNLSARVLMLENNVKLLKDNL